MELEMEIIAGTSTPPLSAAPCVPPIAIDAKSRAIELRRAGVPLSQIAKQLNAPQSSVWRWTRGAVA